MDNEFPLEELIRRVRSGDEHAAAQLVRQYEPELRRFVRYRLTDPHIRKFIDSLDVTQSVFAKFFLRLSEGRLEVANPRQLIKLLATMATNKMHDHYRRTRTLKRDASRPAGSREPEETIVDGQPGPDDASMTRDFVEAFRRRLDEKEQHLLDSRMSGTDWQQIAAESQENPDALRKRLSRAIDRVAEDMGLGDAS